MTSALFAAFLRSLTMLVLAYATAALAFNTLLLIPSPARSANRSAVRANSGVTMCEYLPTGDIASCTVQH